MDDHHLHPIIFKLQFVMLGFHLGGVLCHGKIRRQTHNYGCAEKSAQHGAAS